MPTPDFLDTIDLQDHSAPSAKNHPKHPGKIDTKNIFNDNLDLAPHQASTLREVAHEAAEEQARSPRVSWSEGGEPVGGVTDKAAILQNGNMAAATAASAAMRMHANADLQDSSDEGDLAHHVEEDDDEDEDDDDDLDDDMMDKISSSPSIEDGGYFTMSNMPESRFKWPQRVDSLPSHQRERSIPKLERVAEEDGDDEELKEKGWRKTVAEDMGRKRTSSTGSESGSSTSYHNALESIPSHSTDIYPQDAHLLLRRQAPDNSSEAEYGYYNGKEYWYTDEDESWVTIEESAEFGVRAEDGSG